MPEIEFSTHAKEMLIEMSQLSSSQKRWSQVSYWISMRLDVLWGSRFSL
jgi:hypothetical protein